MRSGWLLMLAACSYSPEPAGGDAPPAVLDSFDVAAQCPADYTLTLPGQTSRYRVITEDDKAWRQSDDCNDDLAGATHLATIDSAAELDEIEKALNAIGNLDSNTAWIGGVQVRGQPAPIASWLAVTGGTMISTVWDDGEPNDGGDNQENSEENFVGVERDREGIVDFPSNSDRGALCECDGKPVDAAAAAAIDANRQ